MATPLCTRAPLVDDRVLSGLGPASRATAVPLRDGLCILHRRTRGRVGAFEQFRQKAAQATLIGDVFDDAATGQGLLNYFLRALNCGAITEAEALSMSGLTLEELHSRSFLKILNSRRVG